MRLVSVMAGVLAASLALPAFAAKHDYDVVFVGETPVRVSLDDDATDPVVISSKELVAGIPRGTITLTYQDGQLVASSLWRHSALKAVATGTGNLLVGKGDTLTNQQVIDPQTDKPVMLLYQEATKKDRAHYFAYLYPLRTN